MALADLPPELFIFLVRFLDTRDALALCATARSLHSTLHDLVFTRHVRHMPCGSSPLWWAVQHGELGLARKALQAGADPNEFSYMRDIDLYEAPLLTAIQVSGLAMVKLLLEHGANPAAVNEEHTALTLAASKGDLEIVSLLLDTAQPGSSIINALNSCGMTALHEAVTPKPSSAAMCHLLLQRGAKLEARSLSGYTPFLEAICHGANDAAAYLAQAGADVARLTHDGSSCLFLAVRAMNLLEESNGAMGNLQLVLRLLKSRPDWSVLLREPQEELHALLCDASLPALLLLLQGGISPDPLRNGATPLLVLAAGDTAKVAFWETPSDPKDVSREVLLIAFGADRNFALPKTGATVLMQAAMRCAPHVVQLLLGYGLDNTDAQDHDGNTALDYAVKWGPCDESVELLYAHKERMEADDSGSEADHSSTESVVSDGEESDD
ncbi:ankyrin repeat domain-containing protein 50 [Microdochium nivale]|nr:ankyrin repeat domain-containing protein 50 [Microdochium nivale]